MKTITYTYDELHAFSKHAAWCVLEADRQNQPVDDNLQSFIDKTLYRWYANDWQKKKNYWKNQ